MLEIFKESTFLYPLISLALIAIPLALLGIFVIFKRISFFSDAISHSSIFAIALAYLLGININIVAILWVILFSILLFVLKEKTKLDLGLLVMILSILGLSLGVIIFSYIPYIKGNINSFLFGNIFLVSLEDLIIILLAAILVILFFIFKTKDLVMISLNEDLAYTENINVKKINFIFNLILAIVIVLGIKFLGALLISAILLIPTSIAKMIANSFKELIFYSLFYSETISIFSFFISYFLNIPLGPCMVILGSLIFLTILTFQRKII